VKEGSFAAGTISGWCKELAVELEVESPADHDQLVELVRRADRACYASRALERPVPTRLEVRLNNEPVDIPM
jgi:organic hydroperoxide reductase OsmC/OhrA